MLKEENYDFLGRRRKVHLENRRNMHLKVKAEEIEIDDSWTIASISIEDPLVKRAVTDLQDYFLVSMGISLKIASSKNKFQIQK